MRDEGSKYDIEICFIDLEHKIINGLSYQKAFDFIPLLSQAMFSPTVAKIIITKRPCESK